MDRWIYLWINKWMREWMDCGTFYEGDTDQSMGSVVRGGGGGGQGERQVGGRQSHDQLIDQSIDRWMNG